VSGLATGWLKFDAEIVERRLIGYYLKIVTTFVAL
jgi:hypothetical protein